MREGDWQPKNKLLSSSPIQPGVTFLLHTNKLLTDKTFSDYFEITILKAYRKPLTRLVEEGTYISSHEGELLNSKNEWHQAKLVRTTTRVIQGGADVLQQGGGGGGGDRPRAGRTWGQG